MKRLLSVALVAGAGFSLQAQALPLVHVYGGAYNWHTKATGYVASDDEERLDFRRDLGFDKKNNTVLFVGVEHAVPIVPNVRFSHVDLKDTGHGTLTKGAMIDDKVFLPGQNVASKYDIDMTDLTLYYSPWKTGAQINLGLTLRRIDADFKVKSNLQQAHLSTTKTLPMAYGEVFAKLPYGFYAGGEINGMGYRGSKLIDSTAKVGWRSPVLLGVEAGYRQLEFKLDDVSDIDADLKFKGPYVSLTVAF